MPAPCPRHGLLGKPLFPCSHPIIVLLLLVKAHTRIQRRTLAAAHTIVFAGCTLERRRRRPGVCLAGCTSELFLLPLTSPLVDYVFTWFTYVAHTSPADVVQDEVNITAIAKLSCYSYMRDKRRA